jgi:hypothetical protein
MAFITVLRLVPGRLGKGEALLRAHRCLRVAAIRPFASKALEPLILSALGYREKALAALRASRYEFSEVWPPPFVRAHSY